MLTVTSTVTSLVLVVKACTLIKEMAIARRFGAGDALDAFYVALVLPTFLMNVVGDSFNAAFIPTYIEVRERHGTRAAERLLSNIAVIDLTVLVAVSLLLATSPGWLLPLLGSSFGLSKLALARTLYLLLLIWLSLSGLSTLWRATLNAREHFALTALIPILSPLTILIVLAVAGNSWGVYSLAVGTVLGVAAELIVCGYVLRLSGSTVIPRWYGFDAYVWKVLSQYAPVVTGSLLIGSTVLVDQTMAAMLGSGNVSALNYANKLLGIPLNLGIYSVSIAVFPTFSLLCAKEDWAGLRRTLRSYTWFLALLTVPLTVTLAWFSEPFVALFFHAGAFTRQDVHLVAKVQSLLCLQVPFYSIGVLYVRAISALKRNHILMWGTTISVCLNVLLNYLFMQLLGLPGIALSTSVVYATSCCYLCFMLSRALRQRESAAAQAPCTAVAASLVN
jgi:putative peptidoglycan lipid II flippase